MKHFKYLKYIIRHKWFVFQECCKLGIPFTGMIHDFSKIYPSEWFPYANYFYGFKMTLDEWIYRNPANIPLKYVDTWIEMDFDFAWLKHQNRNKHHWQWWVLQKDSGKRKAMPMNKRYRKEMLADWRGASRAITGKDETKNWYLKNKDKMILHENTREWIEKQLDI